MLTGHRRPCHFHGNRLYFAPGWETRLRDIGLLPGRAWEQLTPGNLVTRSKRVNTYRVELAGGEVVYFKRYLAYGKFFKYYMLASPAAVEVFSYRQLAAMGISCAEPVALGEMRRYGSLFACCIVTREIPETMTLAEYAERHWKFLPAESRRRVLAFVSGRICRDLQTMHSNCFFHFDPKWRNIMVRCDAAERVTGIWWIDIPRGRYLPARRRTYGIVYDLTNLSRKALSVLSRSQRLRFLYDYCPAGTGRDEIRELVERIDLRLRRKPVKGWPRRTLSQADAGRS